MLATIQSRTSRLPPKIVRTIILPAVLYEYETWSLPLRGKPILKAFENIAQENIWAGG
jgi:hypothetical protein